MEGGVVVTDGEEEVEGCSECGGGWCAAPAVSRAVREGQDRLWSHSVLRESRVAEVRREVRVAVGTSAVRVAGSGARAVLLLREVLRASRMRAAYESGGASCWRAPTTA